MNKNISLLTIISYGVANLGGAALTQAFGVRVYDFYENEMFLNGFLIALAWILYGVWNAINDPLAGYLSDRTWGFTKRWGRRIPWITITLMPFSVFYVLIFTPPDQKNQISLFFWLLFTICCFDTFFTVWGLNYAAVLPEKFRTDKERSMTVSIKYIFSMIGLVVGLLLPPLFIKYGNRFSFVFAAFVITIVSLIPLLLGLPGSRDTKEMIEAAAKRSESDKKPPSFISSLIQVFKLRNARTFFLVNMCFQSMQVITLASVPYYVRSVLGQDAIYETILLGSILAMAVVSIPVWYQVIKRIGTRKTTIMSAVFCALGLSVVVFPVPIIPSIIAMGILGIGLGGELIAIDVALTDVIDEDTVKYKSRREGLYYGINGLMIRFSLIFQAITFTLIHFFTNYQEGSKVQNPAAILGIRFHFGLVPFLFMAAVILLIWRFYNLKPDKVKELKSELKRLEL